ncbi:hypothetical protein BAR24_09380 [Gluconobacter oxydans]|uniref:hypothetical protein n=1 Tax=Gluconobacter thailandicus TaxID=257438 RepID=UPI000495C0D2|nr:hypothetical protein [Gluconobacter thailandicus]ANQ41652.1 hypothetical protein BAR24_09380 [Gluconobacter oxydans]
MHDLLPQRFPELVSTRDLPSIIGLSTRTVCGLMDRNQFIYQRIARHTRMIVPTDVLREQLQVHMRCDGKRGVRPDDIDQILRSYHRIPGLIKIEHVEKYFQVSRSTVRRCAADNLLTTLHIGRSHYILSESAVLVFKRRVPEHA